MKGTRKRLEINNLVAQKLIQYADLLEIKGENPYKVRAYRMAAHSVLSLDEPVSQLPDHVLLDLDGIGKSILSKIREIERTGTFKEFQELTEELPIELLELRGIPGLTPQLIKKLYETLRITRLEELEGALKRGELSLVKGIGPKTIQKIRRGLETKRLSATYKPLWLAWDVAWDLAQVLTDYVHRLSVAGSTRRMNYRVRNLDMVLTLKDNLSLEELKRLIDEEYVAFSKFLSQEEVPLGTLLVFETAKAITVRILVTREELFGIALVLMTGSQEHLKRLSEVASDRGYTLNREGLFRDGTMLKVFEESDLYDILGLQYIPPEIREDRGELELALEGAIPRLVELDDIRGDLHMHTIYSDGANTVYEMALRAKNLGYEYIAIADHSQSLKVGGGLSPETLREQWAEIEAVKEKLGIDILRGSEVDILPDGSLDYDEDVLRGLEFVVGSVHSRFRMSEGEMTQRVKRALSNPYLHALGHPTGRLICIRESYSINLDEVIEFASKVGKLLEVNSNPNRLDLWDEPLLKARKLGVKVVINTDAHSADQLSYMFFGVGQARRAFLTPDDVINTYPRDKLRKFLREMRDKAFK